MTSLWGMDDELKDYLKRQQVIRIVIPWTSGTGHQSIAVGFVRWVRLHGYTGQIQILTGSDVVPSIARLVPDTLAVSSSDVLRQNIPSLNAELISSPGASFDKRISLEAVPLMIVGGDDMPVNPQDFQSRYAIVIQPVGWPGKAPHIYTSDGQRIEFPEFRASPMDAISLEINDEKKFMADQLSGTTHEAKLQVLQKLADQRTEIDLLMTYDNMPYGNRHLPLIEGLEKAKDDRAELFGKPIVIVSLVDDPGQKKREYDLKKKFPHIKILDAKDPKTVQSLSDAKAGDVILLNVGSLPQELFHHMLGSGTLPALVTGSNSTNYLKRVGKMFISTAQDTPTLPED